MTRLINWVLKHTGKRWNAEQDAILRDWVRGDEMIGQL